MTIMGLDTLFLRSPFLELASSRSDDSELLLPLTLLFNLSKLIRVCIFHNGIGECTENRLVY